MAEAPPNAPSPDTAWTTGLAPELIGHAQNKGWDKLTPVEAAKAALTAHREAQGYIGVPEAQIIKLPAAGAAPDAWNPVWEKLGRPKTAAEYDFTTVKTAAGAAPDAQFLDMVRKEAFSRGLSKSAALDHAKALIGWTEAEDARDQTTRLAEATTARKALMDNWGATAEARLTRAKRVATMAGFTPEELAAAEGTKGYAFIMGLMDKVAEKAGEDVFTPNGKGNGDPLTMTKEQAIAKKAELMGDDAWRKRYLEGGQAENREFASLIAVEVATRA